MPMEKTRLDRLMQIGERQREIFKEALALEEERDKIMHELSLAPVAAPPLVAPASVIVEPRIRKPRGKKGVVPLPVGQSIQRKKLDALKTQIANMDPNAFNTLGRNFVHEWYPKLCNTPAWHELSTTLQHHFGARRQQVAGIAARIARVDGEKHVESRQTHA